jgi:hypothetical protein
MNKGFRDNYRCKEHEQMSHVNKLVCFVGVFGFIALLVSFLHAGPIVVSGGPGNDYESWIARLSDHRLMVVFDRNPDWASGDLYVTFSSDDGSTWSEPQLIISESGDQATLSFVQMPDGLLRLWYASNQGGAYAIYTAHSEDGEVWTVDGPIDLGWSSSTTHYDPTVILEADSSLTMSYVVSSSGVYIAHCPWGGDWDTDMTMVSSSGYRARVTKHSNNTYLYAYHKRTGGTYDYDVFVTTSTDRINWSAPVRLTNNMNSHDPFPGEMSDGAYIVYYAKYVAPAYNLCRRRSYDAVNWEPEEQITLDATNNTQPHFFAEMNYIYLVYAHAVSYPDDHDVYFDRSIYEPAFVCGDVDGSSEVDIDDVVYLINYIFAGGPPPDPIESGDADCSGGIDIDDVVYLIAFIFSGGPEPCADC